jgi:3-mercaptopyruvate sulfurtransferase SseA
LVPLEPLLKDFVSKDFLKTSHGASECHDCHGGNPSASSKEESHKGYDPYPSVNNPEKACGKCHSDMVKTISESLHRTLAPYSTILKARSDMTKWDKIDHARERHCGYCHTGCGGCHVSRPKSSQGGFINGHIFKKYPDMINQCTACHGSRIGSEYFGKRGQGDIHALKYNMDCVSCHKTEEMHAAAPVDLKDRYHFKEKVNCVDCHEGLEYGSICDHEIHAGKVQCQACHSQTYTNCYACHTGTDSQGLPYYKNQKDEESMKIGLNYEKAAPGANYNYMLVRHIPANPELFDFYVKDAFKSFDVVPTWKRTSPHNIQRKTWQNATCNNCHGKRDLFLSEKDLLDYEITANRQVVVPDYRVPKEIEKTVKLRIDTSRVRTDMVVDAEWFRNNMGKSSLVIVDARTEDDYSQDHIEGAVSLDPMKGRGGIRWPWNTAKPAQLVDPERLAKILGDTGIAATDHIVVYGEDGWRAGFLLSVLEYAGATNISFLKGGIRTWHELGFPLSRENPLIKPKTFEINPRPKFIVDNKFVKDNLDNPDIILVDVRSLDYPNKLSKHERAIRPGRIPGSIKFPYTALYKDHANLKTPEELIFLTTSCGITPDKTVVLTCNTGAWAGAAFFVLRYLGYPDLRVHEKSWVGWCLQNCDMGY